MIKDVILKGEAQALSKILKAHPEWANQPITFGLLGKNKVHPLHYVCDCIFEKKLEEDISLKLVEVLVTMGADVNGVMGTGMATTADTPLIAASSLYCDQIALFLIDRGADLRKRGTHGGTCLHWAAWTGSPTIVARLLQEGMPVDDQNDEFRSTPLLWAINGWIHNNTRNHRQQPKIIGYLLEAGADPNAVDGAGRRALDILASGDHPALESLLEAYGGKRS